MGRAQELATSTWSLRVLDGMVAVFDAKEGRGGKSEFVERAAEVDDSLAEIYVEGDSTKPRPGRSPR